MFDFPGFGGGLNHLAVELYLVQMRLAVELPRVGVTKPVVRNFDLCAIDYFLPENSILITYSVPVRRYRHGSHGVEETGRKSSQATVPEPGILFFGKYLGKIVAEGFHGVSEIIL